MTQHKDRLNCLVGCPGVQVAEGQVCSDIKVGAGGFCEDDRWVTSGGRVALAILGGLVLVGAGIAGYIALMREAYKNDKYPRW
jgi:hypothetical protein